MKAYWWQGGLHLEPEGPQDTNALMALWNVSRGGADKENTEPPCQTSSCVSEKRPNSVVAD
jgi:hypothetical protein